MGDLALAKVTFEVTFRFRSAARQTQPSPLICKAHLVLLFTLKIYIFALLTLQY